MSDEKGQTQDSLTVPIPARPDSPTALVAYRLLPTACKLLPLRVRTRSRSAVIKPFLRISAMRRAVTSGKWQVTRKDRTKGRGQEVGKLGGNPREGKTRGGQFSQFGRSFLCFGLPVGQTRDYSIDTVQVIESIIERSGRG